jgi:hypothetical protein
MPEREVWRVWEELGTNPPEPQATEIAKALGKVSSKHSAAVLASMHRSRKEAFVSGVYRFSAPGIALLRMSQQVDGELKVYVDSLLRTIQKSDYPVSMPSD